MNTIGPKPQEVIQKRQDEERARASLALENEKLGHQMSYLKCHLEVKVSDDELRRRWLEFKRSVEA